MDRCPMEADTFIVRDAVMFTHPDLGDFTKRPICKQVAFEFQEKPFPFH